MRRAQRTLARPLAVVDGGDRLGAAMSIRPAAAGSGITFVRRDHPGRAAIVAAPASAAIVGDGLAVGPVDGRIRGVDLLLAALWSVGIDNALIEVEGPRLPGRERGAATLERLLECVGSTAQDQWLEGLAPSAPLVLREPGGEVRIVAAADTELIVADAPPGTPAPVALRAALMLLGRRPRARITCIGGSPALFLRVAVMLADPPGGTAPAPPRPPRHDPRTAVPIPA